MASPLATIGILSIGDMGLGVAKLLTANGYQVTTNITGRSQATHARAALASVTCLSSDEELAATSDYILSIVPPRDAMATAERIMHVTKTPSFAKRHGPLYYLDLNAVSPKLLRDMAELFKPAGDSIRLIDGAIIGSPPSPKDASATLHSWNRPAFPMCGPHKLADANQHGAHLANVLGTQHISDHIGAASALKMTFAALTKGFTALAIQSFTTAHRLGVLPELQHHLKLYSPKTYDLTNASMVKMPPKAYRWVREMDEIAATFADDGGFQDDEAIFQGIAKTYDLVANGTDLGMEKTEQRSRGMTAEDVALLMSQGIEKRKQKLE